MSDFLNTRRDTSPEQSPSGSGALHTGEEVRAAYASGSRQFANWRLTDADLPNAQLRDANFSGADLRGANLSGADLTQANLGQANLSGAALRGTNLRGAFLDRADFTNADMTGVIRDQPPSSTASYAAFASPAPLTVRFCIYCRTVMPVGASFCPLCGQSQPRMPSPSGQSVPLAYGAPAQQPNPPSSAGFGPASVPMIGVNGAPIHMPLPPDRQAALSTPLAAHSSLYAPPVPRKPDTMNVKIATLGATAAALAFFLPAYVGIGTQGATGPQVASAFSTMSSLCDQYSTLIAASSGAQSACSFSSIAGPALWLQAILAGVAAIIAGRHWYNANQMGTPIPERSGIGVLFTAGGSLLIILFQFFVLPSIVGSATGISAIGSAVGAAFGVGFWLMALGTGAAVFGAIRQLRS